MSNRRKILKSKFLDKVIPQLGAFVAETIINKQIKEYKSPKFELKNVDCETLVKELREEHQRELKRKEGIENKAKEMFFVIALIITISTVILSNIGKILKAELWWVLPLIMGLLSLLFSVVCCIKAFNIRTYHDVLPTRKFEKRDEYITYTDKSHADQILEYYDAIKLNQLETNVRSNHTYAAMIGTRNGILIIAIVFVTLIFVNSLRSGILKTLSNSAKILQPAEEMLKLKSINSDISNLLDMRKDTVQKRDSTFSTNKP